MLYPATGPCAVTMSLGVLAGIVVASEHEIDKQLGLSTHEAVQKIDKRLQQCMPRDRITLY